MWGRVTALAGLLLAGVTLAGCSLLSDFGDYEIADETTDGGTDSRDAAAADADTALACSRDSDCDDDDACNGDEVCGPAGRCQEGTEFKCDASDDPCRKNVCVSDAGEARCELRDANEGDSCAEDDETSRSVGTCASDYVCVKGACEPDTVETCAPSQCEVAAGCAPGEGCRYAPRPASRDCDDGDPCTLSDKCSGTDDTCAGTPKNCADAIGCTDDTCDAGNCVHTANDMHCEEDCRAGLCDAVTDCGNWTNEVDFTDCDDGVGTTSPDFCYVGACVGGSERAPSASCEVGGCTCSGWLSPQDLEYVDGTYVGLIDATHAGGKGGCTNGTVSIVYDVTPGDLTYYTTDTAGGGAVASPGADVSGRYVVSNGEVGILDPSSQSVDWIDTAMKASLGSDTPLIVNYQGIAFHHEGSIIGGSTHAWVWGDDSGTPSSSRLVRCSWNPCIISPCVDPEPTCFYENLWTTSTLTGVTPYTKPGALQSTIYVGAIGVRNADSGSPAKYVMEEGVTKNYSLDANDRGDTDGAWHGTLARGSGRVLVFGRGTVNLVQCDDSGYSGDAVCAAITGLPNQTSRNYFDATQTSGGGIALLASSCISGSCLTITYYLAVCPGGADPTLGSNWREFVIGSYSLTGKNRVPSEIAAGGTVNDGYSITVLGRKGSEPYVWQWATVP